MQNAPRLVVLAFVSATFGAPGPAASATDDGAASFPDSTPADAVLAPGVDRRTASERAASDGPLAVFASVERAWSAGEADSLVALLDPVERVQLSFVRGGPRGGYFNRDQAFFLLKDLFEFTTTDRFEFQKYWNLEENGRSPYAVAHRELRMNDGAKHTDQVYIALRRRENRWVVGEIRSVDR